VCSLKQPGAVISSHLPNSQQKGHLRKMKQFLNQGEGRTHEGNSVDFDQTTG
jgi:hypothetical protein